MKGSKVTGCPFSCVALVMYSESSSEVQLPTPPFLLCVALGQSQTCLVLTASVKRESKSYSTLYLLLGLKKVINLKCLADSQAYSKCYVNITSLFFVIIQ